MSLIEKLDAKIQATEEAERARILAAKALAAEIQQIKPTPQATESVLPRKLGNAEEEKTGMFEDLDKMLHIAENVYALGDYLNAVKIKSGMIHKPEDALQITFISGRESYSHEYTWGSDVSPDYGGTSIATNHYEYRGYSIHSGTQDYPIYTTRNKIFIGFTEITDYLRPEWQLRAMVGEMNEAQLGLSSTILVDLDLFKNASTYDIRGDSNTYFQRRKIIGRVGFADGKREQFEERLSSIVAANLPFLISSNK